MSGIDMMIGAGIYLPALCLINWALQHRGTFGLTVALASIILSIIFYIIGGSWLYRALRFLPMSVPHCPHCQAQGPFFHHARREACCGFLCSHCEGYFEVWFGKVPQEHVPSGYAELALRFPYHFGGYTLLYAEQVGKAVTVDESTSPIKGVFELEAEGREDLLTEALSLWPDLTPDKAGGFVEPHGLVWFKLTDNGVEAELRRSHDHRSNARHLNRLYRLGCWVREHYSHAIWRGADGDIVKLE